MSDELEQKTEVAPVEPVVFMAPEVVEPEPTEEAPVVEKSESPHGDKEELEWKAAARKWERIAKKNLADSEALASAQQEALEARTALLRYQVAAEKGIPADAVKLLAGSSKEELEDSADVLLSLVAEQVKPKTPRPDSNQGKPAVGNMSTKDAFAAALDGLL